MEKEIRKLIVEAAYHAKHGHMPSALSITDIICALHNIMTPEDIFILSKGHGCLAYYAYLVLIGELTADELYNFGKAGSKLGGHPDKNKIDKVYTSTGSLGHGLPTAVGAAIARKITNKPGKFYCIVGDGECNEGSIWESVMLAVTHKLDNLICIVDYNQSQIRSLPLNNLKNKFQSFGCNSIEVNGHNITEISKSLSNTETNKPLFIIANTIKGKGISQLESDMFSWHHKAPTTEQYINFIQEIYEK